MPEVEQRTKPGGHHEFRVLREIGGDDSPWSRSTGYNYLRIEQRLRLSSSERERERERQLRGGGAG